MGGRLPRQDLALPPESVWIQEWFILHRWEGDKREPAVGTNVFSVALSSGAPGDARAGPLECNAPRRARPERAGGAERPLHVRACPLPGAEATPASSPPGGLLQWAPFKITHKSAVSRLFLNLHATKSVHAVTWKGGLGALVDFPKINSTEWMKI